MENTAHRAIAIVGCGAVLPDAPNVSAFWKNVTSGRYSIREVPPDRWDPALFYDPDRNAPDKTYSKIGGWISEFEWDPLAWRIPVPPRVADAMDIAQKWAIASTREALADYGYPERPLNTERTAVILGNAMAGERHYLTALRAFFPEYARELEEGVTFAALPEGMRRDITREFHKRVSALYPEITEDSMPGELANCLAGRIANVYNFRGPNFVCDAACASAMAAIRAAAEGLVEREFDVAVSGGIDRNMGASTFIKFSKIGALSATGSRPYAEGADGFVMGEGTVIFLMKRLADAERDGDRIYAVLRGIGASSDGRGKGITAPNPIGQKLCIERAWEIAGVSPATATLIEGHGTSTSVGDVVEYESLAGVLKKYNVPAGSVALGSVKSNIGHLKGAAGAAGLLKVVLALRDKVLPPSVQCDHPNPAIDFAHAPLCVNRELKPWTVTNGDIRCAGASAFGFGGTNFHAVLEEFVPHRLTGNGKRSVVVGEAPPTEHVPSGKAPLRGALVTGGATASELAERLRSVQQAAAKGHAPSPAPPSQSDLHAAERIAIDYADAAELADKAAKALKALAGDQPAVWKALRAQGIFRGHGAPPKVAFLYTGQGSQYVNMLQPLRKIEPIVAQTFEEADRIMTPLLGKPLSHFIFVEGADPDAVAKAEEDLRQTAITQPAVLATDLALTRLLAAYGIRPDMTMGHSLGEYGALQAAGALPFADALEAVSARGRGMTQVAMADNGRMAAVFAPIPEIERILKTIDGYVVIANLNSDRQAVIGGASKGVELAAAALISAGYDVVPLPVSHAFHTSIVAGASEPLRRVLERLHLESPHLPVVTNVTGTFYPAGPDAAPAMLDILAQQVFSPVQFVKGLRTLYEAGARVFVEVGPKKALQGFAEDVLGEHADVLAIFTNHPKTGDVASFNQALCGLYAAGLGASSHDAQRTTQNTAQPVEVPRRGPAPPVVITGASLGLPGTGRIFDDTNVARILRGEQFIDVIPTRFRNNILDKHITRLVKSENGDPTFEQISKPADVLKLAARGGPFDLREEFGVSAERVACFDRVTGLAIAAGIDALRDAGIPLTLRYKNTTRGTQLPDRWGLPDALRDDTGVIFASVFPGYDSFADEMARYYADRSRREQAAMLRGLRDKAANSNGHSVMAQEIDRRIGELEQAMAQEPYCLDRRFLFRMLSMGHSQFAELIGARGPNTQINAACASTTQAVTLAEDWIRAGRCRRVIVISADDITSDHLIEWFGAGFLASGAAATDDVVEEAAIPFDRRRHGMIMGMGAAALVVETPESAVERGLRPICELVGAITANSAFHGTRLDVHHIRNVMEEVVRQAEQRSGVGRAQMAPRMVFVSHETYTPARGGSASAEIHALRAVFGAVADQIVIANTKGFTGHAMGTGIEDVVAVKALETGWVPPVANFKEVDPELGPLNLSKGGIYPIDFALRLGAGFGSQISMSLLRRVETSGARQSPAQLGYAYRITDAAAWQAWIERISGHPADLEVVNRTLRVRDQGAKVPAAPPLKVAEVVTPPLPSKAPEPAPLPPTSVPVAVQAEDSVQARVLALVAEKTGYPIEMLDLDSDLEADLGIDTVKQAEVFAAIRESYGIARDDKIKLRDYSTIAQVIRFVHERRQPETPTPAAPMCQTNAAELAVEQRILDLVVEKTGYPKDMLDLDLDLEADLGVDTVKQAEMFASIREIYDIPRDPNLKLRDFPTLARVIGFVFDRRPDLKQTAPAPAAVQPVTPPVPDPAPPPPLTPPPSNLDALQEKVLEIVAEKTGYPKEMLDLDLDLEADLGIDTVKQAEMFASVRATFGISRDQNLKLRDFPTLAHVIQFARDRQTTVSEQTSAEQPSVAIPTSFEAADTVPRRVPVPQLRPPLASCKPTGVSFTAGRRIAIMNDGGGVGIALAEQLRALGVEVLSIEEALTAGPVHGVFWLPAMDAEGDLSRIEFAGWREALKLRVKSLYATMRALYDQIAPAGTFLVAATRLGGQHGYDAAGALAPLGGAVTGFTKTYKRERPDVLVKAVDFDGDLAASEVASLLIAETLRDPGAVEIGYQQGLRWTVGLEERPVANGEPGLTLDSNSVFLITGAAGSIVSAITSDLAAASGGTFYLLDLVPEPDPNNPDLARFVNDKDGLKRELFARIQARGERATPALVEKELAVLERAHAARHAIDAVSAAGGTAHYFSVDLADSAAVAKVIDQVRQRSGRIDVLLHAAGIERSHFLPDKDQREFDLVFDVKADGWFNLLHAIGDMPLGATVAFSSIAGRFGNAGQSDYSSANDLLCKIASSFRTTRPATRALAIDWTAWGGIGMATRGSIPKMMELAGIDMLPPEAGIPWIRRELTAGSGCGEIVVGQRLGVLLDPWDPNGGLDAEAPAQGPMLGHVAGIDPRGELTFETALDPVLQPFLHDHQIEGTPVLPGVMGIEAFAEAALWMAPGWTVEAIENIDFLAPFKFYRSEPRTLAIQAAFHAGDRCLLADCRLIGRRQLPNQAEPQVTTHFTARVRLTKQAPAGSAAGADVTTNGSLIESSDIYRVYFHGPAYQVVKRAWWEENRIVGEMAADLPPNHHPVEQPLAAAPRLIELCFQAAGLLEMAVQHRMGLPRHVDRVSIYRPEAHANGPLHAIVTSDPTRESFDAEVVDGDGNRYIQVLGYRTVVFRNDVTAELLRPLAVIVG